MRWLAALLVVTSVVGCQLFTGTGDLEYRDGSGGAGASSGATGTGSTGTDTSSSTTDASSSTGSGPPRECNTCYSAAMDGPAPGVVPPGDFCDLEQGVLYERVVACATDFIRCREYCNGVSNPYADFECLTCMSFACKDVTLECLRSDPLGCVNCAVAAGTLAPRNGDPGPPDYCPGSETVYVALLDDCVCGAGHDCSDRCTNDVGACIAVSKANTCLECVGDELCGEDCSKDGLPPPPPLAR